MSGLQQQRLVAALTAHFGTADARIAAAWLFGSQARGTARRDSDVDIGVLYGEPPDWASPGPATTNDLGDLLAFASSLRQRL